MARTGNKYEMGLATIEKKRNLIDEFKRWNSCRVSFCQTEWQLCQGTSFLRSGGISEKQETFRYLSAPISFKAQLIQDSVPILTAPPRAHSIGVHKASWGRLWEHRIKWMGLVTNLQTPQSSDSVPAKLPCVRGGPRPGEVPRETLCLIYRGFPKSRVWCSQRQLLFVCPCQGEEQPHPRCCDIWGPQSCCCSAPLAASPDRKMGICQRITWTAKPAAVCGTLCTLPMCTVCLYFLPLLNSVK